MAPFPLETFTEGEFLRLGEVLWSWKLCEGCRSGDPCVTEDCPSRRSKRLLRYLRFYKDITASYDPDTGAGEEPALRSHDDLLQVIAELKSDPALDREKLANTVFTKHAGRNKPISAADQERAIDLAYISDLFPQTNHPSLNDDDNTDTSSLLSVKTALMARKLKKRIGLKFRPTDDLRNHLRLDTKINVLDLYHHTAFLKEHLRLTKSSKEIPRNASIQDSFKRGALPRQLALETLDSLQKILFPLADPKSSSLLFSLTSSSTFDPDCLRFESTAIRDDDEKDISYYYLGARLADLYDAIEKPKPRGRIEKWLERKSGARYVMLATLMGVIIAILLGMASLGVSGYQTWLTYQQWQHPVQPPSANSTV
ncbi:MAG: hypothetical protein M1816_002943 [Peltula sp. TS41687]|nr:MAG: hypothetical protein M1816_002943 [Peltula sp. TS41687]